MSNIFTRFRGPRVIKRLPATGPFADFTLEEFKMAECWAKQSTWERLVSEIRSGFPPGALMTANFFLYPFFINLFEIRDQAVLGLVLGILQDDDGEQDGRTCSSIIKKKIG